MHCNLWISIFERSRCHLLFSEYPKDGKSTDSKISGGRDMKALDIVCFRQTKCKVTIDICFWSSILCSFTWYPWFLLSMAVAFSTFSYWLLKILLQSTKNRHFKDWKDFRVEPSTTIKTSNANSIWHVRKRNGTPRFTHHPYPPPCLIVSQRSSAKEDYDKRITFHCQKYLGKIVHSIVLLSNLSFQ